RCSRAGGVGSRRMAFRSRDRVEQAAEGARKDTLVAVADLAGLHPCAHKRHHWREQLLLIRRPDTGCALWPDELFRVAKHRLHRGVGVAEIAERWGRQPLAHWSR